MVSDGLRTENIAAGTFNTTGNLVLSAGSPYSQGIVVPMTARGAITGGIGNAVRSVFSAKQFARDSLPEITETTQHRSKNYSKTQTTRSRR